MKTKKYNPIKSGDQLYPPDGREPRPTDPNELAKCIVVQNTDDVRAEPS